MIRETTIQKLLSKLITLYDAVSENRQIRLTEECRKLGISAVYQHEMVKNGVIVNMGSKRNPEWSFSGVRPNKYMAEEIIKRSNKSNNERRENRKKEKLMNTEVDYTVATPCSTLKRDGGNLHQKKVTPLEKLKIGELYCCALSMKGCQYIGGDELLMWDDNNCHYMKVRAFPGMLFYDADEMFQ